MTVTQTDFQQAQVTPISLGPLKRSSGQFKFRSGVMYRHAALAQVCLLVAHFGKWMREWVKLIATRDSTCCD